MSESERRMRRNERPVYAFKISSPPNRRYRYGNRFELTAAKRVHQQLVGPFSAGARGKQRAGIGQSQPGVTETSWRLGQLKMFCCCLRFHASEGSPGPPGLRRWSLSSSTEWSTVNARRQSRVHSYLIGAIVREVAH